MDKPLKQQGIKLTKNAGNRCSTSEWCQPGLVISFATVFPLTALVTQPISVVENNQVRRVNKTLSPEGAVKKAREPEGRNKCSVSHNSGLFD